MPEKSDYYVYVYIDPRNYEEFYYGKGQNDRKNAHLKDRGDSEKAKRIAEIRKVGLKPIIKVIAKQLTEHEALLIEKTLIWKLGRNLTNASSGYFADKFRPHNTLYTDLYGFDYQNGIYFFNVDEGHGRNWDDCRKYGYLSAGVDELFIKQIQSFSEGDIALAYVSRKGYVGVGMVTEEAVAAKDFRINGKSLYELDLISKKKMIANINNPKISEHIVKVDWKASCGTKDAKWIKDGNLFAPRMAKASMQNQTLTLGFVSRAFKIDVNNLLRNEDLAR